MAEFILKDWHGKEKAFDHETIYVRGTDGELMPFTHGTGNPVLEELEVTENGSYTPSEGVDGFGYVKVNVPDIPAVVQPLEITENGTYTAPDGVDGFSSVTVNVGAAKIAVLEEHEMTGFAPDSTWGYSTLDQAPSYTINEGEQYYVKWDGETYPVMLTDGSSAVAGATYLGNGSAFNLPGNGEPFAIVFVGGMILYTAFNDPKESHTIGIYKDGTAGSDELKYVTFKSYDGSVEYGKKAVAKGDDCADPIARGVFSTPTREADAQYTYTFYGWATEPNGGAVSNWNKAINEDKTVYANFSKAVRYYTITYYDSDGTTVLKTQSLAYGTTPSYTPNKDGYNFKGWIPALETVTGDASYTAQFMQNLGFAGYTWEEIIAISESGQASQYFSIGDTRPLVLTDSNGTTEEITVAIAAFDHDDLADGTGKAGMTLVNMTVPSTTTAWCSSTNTTYYKKPAGSNAWIYGSLVNDLLDGSSPSVRTKMPAALRNALKSVTKTYDGYTGSEGTVYTDSFKVWALSLDELGCDINSTSGYTASYFNAIGTRYPIFPAVTKLTNTPIKASEKLPIAYDTENKAVFYHTRQQRLKGSNTNVMAVSSAGGYDQLEGTYVNNSKYYLRFGFCI